MSTSGDNDDSTGDEESSLQLVVISIAAFVISVLFVGSLCWCIKRYLRARAGHGGFAAGAYSKVRHGLDTEEISFKSRQTDGDVDIELDLYGDDDWGDSGVNVNGTTGVMTEFDKEELEQLKLLEQYQNSLMRNASAAIAQENKENNYFVTEIVPRSSLSNHDISGRRKSEVATE